MNLLHRFEFVIFAVILFCREGIVYATSNRRCIFAAVSSCAIFQCWKCVQIGNFKRFWPSLVISLIPSILSMQMCRYYEFRDNNPELHNEVNPFSLSRLGEDDIVSVAPYRDQHGRRVMIYKIGNWRPSKIPIDDIFRASLILFEMGALEPKTQVLGGIGIFDLEGLSLNHAWYVTPSVARKMISLMVVSICELIEPGICFGLNMIKMILCRLACRCEPTPFILSTIIGHLTWFFKFSNHF